ncbi:MAG: hypothetical protein H7287_14150 [Thermoleophilia bacterium]|nr:hypothetical protein [Thermoleophilia bacterium]
MAKRAESITIRDRRQFTLPTSIYQQFTNVDRFDVSVEDGCIVLRPKVELDVSWYHSDAFQQRERDVDAALVEGRSSTHETGSAALDALDRLRRD